jgi:hypothetical protein
MELIAFSLKPILAALKENLDGVGPEFFLKTVNTKV